jgi:4-hydroxy-tetrahydrodipicolinate synthase
MAARMLSGDVAGAAEIQIRMLPLIRALFCEVNPIPVKAALNMMGMEAGPLRLPLTELEDAHKEQVRSALLEAGLLQ